MASAAETKQASPRDLSNFDFPALDRSKNQFRLLVLAAGDFDDEITATISTKYWPTLPADYNHQPHLTELTAIHDNLSTASSTGIRVQVEELLRWERLYGELMELYAATLCKSPDASGKHRFTAPHQSDIGRLMDMKHLFIGELKQYQSKSCNLSEADAMQALISRLEGEFGFELPFHKYAAVSYCCGNQRIQVYITLNDVRVQVPASAAHALRGIRHDKFPISVWIDAICINPSDSKERTHQVLLMSKIYSSAYSTIVRLESAGDVADQLLSACLVDYHRTLTASLSKCPELIWNAKELIDGNSAVSESLRNATLNLFQSLLVFLNQPWFSRLWVYQEVLLSQFVYVSVARDCIGWTLIRMAIEYYECLSPAPELWDGVNVSGLRVSTPWRARRNGHEDNPTESRNSQFYLGYTPPNLTSLLVETIPLECLNPRDKVYALLGLTSWSVQRKTLPSELEPDYTLPVSECMRNATLAAIGEEMSLECLTLPIWARQDQSWPSWVVPWHKLEVDRNRQYHLNIPNDVARYP
jgi:hypothetical protein